MTYPLRDLERCYHAMPDGSMEYLFDADRMHREHYYLNIEAPRSAVLISDGRMWDPISTGHNIWATKRPSKGIA